jgi:AraC-like DNA-binding protein
MMSLAIGAQAATRGSRAGLYGAGFLAGASLAVTVITLDHAGVQLGLVAPLLEGALTLGGGALFALFIAALLGRTFNPLVMLAPMAAFLAAAALAPALTLRQLNVEYLVLAQAAFTAFAAWMAFTAKMEGKPGLRRRTIARVAVFAVLCIHAAQIVRASSDAEALRDIVPYVTATIFFILAGLVYFGARAAALEPVLSARQRCNEASLLLAMADQTLAAPRLLRKADLTLQEAAASIGASPNALGDALNAERAVTFKEYLQRLRVGEAARLLADPAEARTSMEAIGLLAGFGSRSAFYKAFREQTGVSPAAYRAEICPES